MARKTSVEDRAFLTFDEPVEDRPKILAAVDDAEAKGLYEYGMLTKKFFMIIQGGQINTSINRTSFQANRAFIERLLGKLERTMPAVVYEIDQFA